MANLTAQEFFDTHVVPSLSDWRRDELAIHKAKTAATNLNQMADYYWSEYASDAVKNLGASNLSGFRDTLTQRWPDFGLARDIADSHKHVSITRRSKTVSNESQTREGAMGWDEARWNDARWDSPQEIVITDDAGVKHHFIAVLHRVEEMWRALLV